ncbi:tandem-95 repeat protein, partial [Thermodesulfobacteriota bacterium]
MSAFFSKMYSLWILSFFLLLLSACSGSSGGKLPAAPTNIQVNPGVGQLVISWSGSSGAKSYNIYYSTVSGQGVAGTKVAGVTSPHTIDNLANGTTYYVVVTAKNSKGESKISGQGVGTPTSIPVAVSDVLATDEDTLANGTLSATDSEGDSLVYSIVANGTQGTATITDPATGIYTYSPNSNANGVDTFTFKVNDGTFDSTTATVTVTINPVNDAPSANAGTLVLNEDVPGGGVLGASDVEGDSLIFAIVSNGNKGAALITNPSTGVYTYIPNQNSNGTDSFTFKVNDGVLDSATVTMTVTINGVNDAPSALNGILNINEDSDGSDTLMASDVEGDSLTFAIVSNGTKGNAVITPATGAYTYTPNPNANGEDSFTFKVNDGALDSNTATVTVNITSVNDAPAASSSTMTINEDVVGSSFLNADDPDGDVLTFLLVTDGGKGTVSITGSTGAYTYTPDPDANGSDSFSFKVNDGTLDSNTASVTVTINSVNDAPVASAGVLATDEDTDGNGTLVGNDVDLGDILTYLLVTDGTKGTVGITPATGAYTYTPNSDASGTDSFSFKVNDGTVDSNTATVAVTINSLNDAPVAIAGSLVTDEDVVGSDTLMGSDDDVGDTLTYLMVADGAMGTVSITPATGAYTYTPNPDASGTDSFTFKVNDGTVDSNTATVTVVVNAVNDAPVAVDETVNINEDVPGSSFLDADDLDGDALSYLLVTDGAKGTVLITPATGAYTYTPDPGVNGVDTFVFKVNDGTLDSNNATITVNINGVNDAPIAVDGSLTIDEDTVGSSTLGGSDVDIGDTLNFVLVTDGSKGTVSITNPLTGAYTYTPGAHVNGSDSFTFKVNDSTVDSNTSSVTVTINPVNDVPVVYDGTFATSEDTIGSSFLNASDVEGDTLTFNIETNGSNGFVTITNFQTGAYEYDPNPGFNGSDSFTFSVSDGTDVSN